LTGNQFHWKDRETSEAGDLSGLPATQTIQEENEAIPMPFQPRTRRRTKTSALILGLFASLTLTKQVHAQVDQGSISGTVTDASGAIIPGATVTVTDVNTGLVFSRTTNGSGQYTFSPIKVGDYTVKATATGFATIETTVGYQSVCTRTVLRPTYPAMT
jgi:hypothetical protein